MTRRAGVLVLACLGPWLVPTGASAQDVAEVLAQWGLPGTWAQDCSRPPSAANPHTTYVARPDRSAYHTSNQGAGDDKRPSEIHTASIRTDGVLATTQSTPPFRGSSEIWFAKARDGRKRVELSRINGRHFVLDGMDLSNGRPVPWERRCK